MVHLRYRCRIALTACVLLAWAWGAGNVVRGASGTEEPRPPRRALLVGCAEYPQLPSRYRLRGPTNDVRLMTHLLQTRFGFQEHELVRLWQGEPEAIEPTAHAIEQAFQQLIEQAHAGQEVFILLAGHGSQQPDDPAQAEEPDGLDEVFLPCDIPSWQPGKPVAKAITDDRIGEWITALRRKGAFVFFVADCCHAGTLTRGLDDEVTRYVPPEILWGDAVSAVRLRQAKLGDEVRGQPQRGMPRAAHEVSGEGRLVDAGTEGRAAPANDTLPGGYVALFATPAHALEKEEIMPPRTGRATDPVHGRLSYALSESLHRAAAPLTYRELGQQLQWYYEQWPWEPACLIEGTALDRQVLGPGQWPGRSQIRLTRMPGAVLRVDAGALHGLTVGSLLAVKPWAGTEPSESVLGQVRVTEVSLLSAVVVPQAAPGVKAVPPAAWPERTRCEIVQRDYGELRLRLAARMAPTMSGEVPAGSAELRSLQEMLERISQSPSSLVRLAAADERPEVVALLTPRREVVLHRAGTPLPPADAPVPGCGPWPCDDQLERALDEALRRMARALQLRQLASQYSEATSEAERAVPRFRLEVMPYAKKSAGQLELGPLIERTRPLVLSADDRVAVRVTNTGREPLDVTILYIDNAFQIQSFYPLPRDVGQFANRLVPGKEPAVAYFQITDDTLGLEDVVVIVTRGPAGSSPVNFAHLAQPALPQPGTARGDASPGVAGALDRLFARALFGAGQARGPAAVEAQDYAIARISWTVVRRPSPQAP